MPNAMTIESIITDLSQNGRQGAAFQAFRSAAHENERRDTLKITFLDVLAAMLPAERGA